MIAAFGLPDEPEPGILAPPRNVTAVHLTLLKPDGSDEIRGRRQGAIIDADALGTELGRELRRRAGAGFGLS